MMTKTALTNNSNKQNLINSNSNGDYGKPALNISSKNVGKAATTSIQNNTSIPSSTSGFINIQNQILNSNNMSSVDSSLVDDNEKKIIAEFVHFLEKSKQLFNGLR